MCVKTIIPDLCTMLSYDKYVTMHVNFLSYVFKRHKKTVSGGNVQCRAFVSACKQ